MIKIRLARRDEIQSVLAFWSVATDVRATDTAAALAQLVEGEALIVATDDEELVGSIIAAWDGWRGNIYRLAVTPRLRRRGIAGALVAEAETRLREAGASRVSMIVDTDSEATSFWRSIDGVRLDAHVRRYIKDLD